MDVVVNKVVDKEVDKEVTKVVDPKFILVLSNSNIKKISWRWS